MVSVATNRVVPRDALIEFIRPRHHGVLLTVRSDGRPQASLVTVGTTEDGRIVISTYPDRAKTINAERDPRVSVIIQSDDFGGEWVQIDGIATVAHMPEALDGLVEYFQVISGEHPDWQEYREAMARQDKSLITVEIQQWGPIAKGGFPARLVNDDTGGPR